MKLKRDAKFGEEWTFCFKISIKNLTSFDLTAGKSQNFHFNEFFLSKVYIVWAKKVQRSSLSWNWKGAKFGEELSCRFKIGIRNLTNFDLRARKSEKLSL